MAQIIRIKRSTGSPAPSTLAQGELAYSKGSDSLFIGDPATVNTPIPIGPAIKNNLGTAELSGGITAGSIRTLIGVDPAGTDNSIDQNLFATINANTGTTAANSTADALGIVGAGDISTSITGDVLTISFTGTSTDQDVSVANLQTRLSEITTATTMGTGVGATFSFSSDVTVLGDLTVSGSLTSINTTNTEITDNTILLNQGETGTGVTSTTAGVEIDRGLVANVSLLWNDNTDRWTFTNDGSIFHNMVISGDFIDSVQLSSTDGSITGIGTATPDASGDISFDLQVGVVDGGTY